MKTHSDVHGELTPVMLPSYLLKDEQSLLFSESHEGAGLVWFPDVTVMSRFSAECPRCKGISFVLYVPAQHCPYCGGRLDVDRSEVYSIDLKVLKRQDV
ncbi:MAG: hypothetical protein RBU21_07415 [FCB group bacterium]|jgi:hypothetical protein|nr:hypothetical protein [FCB group bacterium]